MADRKEQVMDEAIAWTIRLRHAEADQWQAFARWREADPAHLAAYESVAALDDGLDDLAPGPAVESRADRGWSSRRSWLGGTVAAAAAAAAAVAWLMIPAPATLYPIETMPGERHMVNLPGGTVIHVNGGSRLLLDRANNRFARLEHGQALFSVVRDPGNPFRVDAGTVQIRNIGTVFDVEREKSEDGDVGIEVAEGAVMISAGGQDLKLTSGETAEVAGKTIETGRRPAAAIGGWRDGQLSYSSATLAEIASDLSRSSGVQVRADPEVANRRFSGIILVDDDRDRLRARLAALLNVNVRLADDGWVLAPVR